MNVTRPIFIVGAPRSGTTLLQVMLSQIPGMHVTAETKFLILTKLRSKLLGSLDDQRGFEQTLAAIRYNVCQWRELPVDLDRLEAELRDTPREYAALFDTLLFHIQQGRPGCRRIGEKSPNHIHFVEYLLKHFDDGQVINILRDGRDAFVSQREAFGTDLVGSAFRWRHYIRLHERFSSTLSPDQYTAVKYEDLVTSPESELKRLCEFLREDFSPELLEHHRRSDAGFTSNESHKHRTLEPVTTSRVRRYQKSLSSNEIAIYQTIAGSELSRLGYPLEKTSKLAGYAGTLARLPSTLAARVAARWSGKPIDATRDWFDAARSGANAGSPHKPVTR